MIYTEYKAMMAYYGFLTCPLTEAEFNKARAMELGLDALYGLGCDVSAGIPFARALYVSMGGL